MGTLVHGGTTYQIRQQKDVRAKCNPVHVKELKQTPSSVSWALHNLDVCANIALQDNRFDLAQLVTYLRSKPDGDLAMYYELQRDELSSSRGIVDVCPTTGRIKRIEI